MFAAFLLAPIAIYHRIGFFLFPHSHLPLHTSDMYSGQMMHVSSRLGPRVYLSASALEKKTRHGQVLGTAHLT